MWQMKVLASISALLHVHPFPCLHETKKPPPLETTQKNNPNPTLKKEKNVIKKTPLGAHLAFSLVA